MNILIRIQKALRVLSTNVKPNLIRCQDWVSTGLSKHIPLFEEKLGPDVPMKLTLHVKDVKVTLGQFDTDMIFEYTFCTSWRPNLLGSHEVFYDEIKAITSLDMKTENELFHINLLNHKLDIDPKLGPKSRPVREKMEVTANEYREFLATLGFTMEYMKKWLNENFFRGGVYAPYNVEEFKTNVLFREKSMHLLLEVEKHA